MRQTVWDLVDVQGRPRYYRPGQHPATFRTREAIAKLEAFPVPSAEINAALVYHREQLAVFDASEAECRARDDLLLREHQDAQPIERLFAVARLHGLHVVLERVVRRWRLGLIRPTSQVARGLRPYRRHQGMPDLADGCVQPAAAALVADLERTPPRGGS